jgi:hypothetical protein
MPCALSLQPATISQGAKWLTIGTRRTQSFTHHIKREHNLWRYVHLLVHLRTKPSTDFNGWESHVAAMLPENRSDNGE